MTSLTQKVVQELLGYNPNTGTLIWKQRDRKWFTTDHQCNAWNAKFAENTAFTSIDKAGYFHGTIFNKTYSAHRIIWIWMTGKWPNPEVDHENHNRADNRWSNLFEKTHQSNTKNISLPRDNTSGQIGVHWFKRTKRWQSHIAVNGRRLHLGFFASFEEAVSARKQAEQKYGFHPNHGDER